MHAGGNEIYLLKSIYSQLAVAEVILYHSRIPQQLNQKISKHSPRRKLQSTDRL